MAKFRHIPSLSVLFATLSLFLGCGTKDSEEALVPPTPASQQQRSLSAASTSLNALYSGEKASFTWVVSGDGPSAKELLKVEHDLITFPQNYYLPDLGMIGAVDDNLSVQYTAPGMITAPTRAALRAQIGELASSSTFFLLPSSEQGIVLSREEESLSVNHPSAQIFLMAAGTATIPNFAGLTPIGKSLVKGLCTGNLSADVPFVGLAKESVNFAIRITGNLRVASAGDYLFRLTSDDGSRMKIGATEVINNDGLHGYSGITSQPVPLNTGSHPFEISFFQGTGNKGLCLEIQAPGTNTFSAVKPEDLLPSGG